MDVNPRRHKLKKVTRRHKGGGGSIGPLPFTFDTIHLIDLIFGTYCCLIGFHGNHSNIMTSLAAAILDFQSFKFFSNSNLNTENSEKTTFSDWNLQNCKIHCKTISI